jgi:acyl carrier protein
MANAVEHLREVAVQKYGVDEAEVANLDPNALTELLLSKIGAASKYKISPSAFEGLNRREEIELLIKHIVRDLSKDEKSELNSDTPLADLGLDSLDQVELLMAIEEMFEPFGEIRLPENDTEITTVGAAAERIDQYVESYISES